MKSNQDSVKSLIHKHDETLQALNSLTPQVKEWVQLEVDQGLLAERFLKKTFEYDHDFTDDDFICFITGDFPTIYGRWNEEHRIRIPYDFFDDPAPYQKKAKKEKARLERNSAARERRLVKRLERELQEAKTKAGVK